MSDLRIKEGLRIALASLMQIQRKLKRHQIAFTVALIPSKELIFHPCHARPSKTMLSIVENESAIWQLTKSHLSDNGVSYIELLPSLQQAVKDGQQPFHMGVSDHPNANGHQAISRAISAWLNTDYQ